MMTANPVKRILADFERQRDEMNRAKPGMGDALMGSYIQQAKASIAAREALDTPGVEHERPCPKCGAGMEHREEDPDYGADADGNRGMYLPGGMGCECGHFIPDEPDDFDQE